MPHRFTTTNSDATYSDIFYNAPYSMFIIDRDFKLTALNNRATEYIQLVLGYVPALGVDVRPIGAFFNLTDFEKHMEEAFAGKLLTLEQPFSSPLVSWNWLETSYIPLKNGQGAVTSVCFAVRDISQRKYTEAALSKSLSFNRAFVNAIPDILLRIDRDGSFANYHAEESDSPLQAKHVENAKAYLTLTLNSGKPQVFESKLEIDGSPYYFETRLIASNENEVLAIVRDITESKIGEEKLKLYIQEAYDLYQHAPCGYHSLDKDGIFININDTELGWLGYTREEVIGKLKISDLFTPQSLETYLTNYPLLMKQGWLKDVEIEIIRKDGRPLHVLVNSTAIKDEAGNFLKTQTVLYDITERKEAQQALRESEQRYRMLAENISDMVVVLGFQSKYLYVSPSCEGVLGYTSEELLGKTGLDFIHPDDRANARNALTNVREKHERDDQLLARFRHKAGYYVWLEGRGQTRFSPETGEPLEFIGSMRDVTAQVEAETALRESEQRYRLLAENITDVIMSLNFKGDYTYASPSAKMVLGYTPEELLGQNGLAFMHPDDTPKAIATLRDSRDNHEDYNNVAFRYRHKAGHYIWVEGRGQTLFSPETGEPLEYITSVRDVTAQVVAETALRESEQRYRLLAENITDVVTITNGLGEYIYISPSAKAVIGYDPVELLGKASGDFLHPEDLPLAIAATRESNAENTAYTDLVIRYRHKAGHYIWVEIQVLKQKRHNAGEDIHKAGHYIWVEIQGQKSRVTDETGEPLEYIASLRDITQRVVAEAAMRESEQRYRLLAENIVDVVIALDKDNIYNYASPSCEKVLGYTSDELKTLWGPGLIHPDDVPILHASIARSRASQTVYESISVRFRHKQGHYIWLELGGQSVFSKLTGKLESLIITLRDVTARKMAETALRESEQRYRLLADNVIDVVIALTKDSQYLYASPSCKRTLGYTSDELKTLWGPGLIHPDDVQIIATSKLSNRVLPADYELIFVRFLHKQGHYIWLEIGGQSVFSELTGELESIIITLHDVTAQKMAEDTLKRSHAFEKLVADISSKLLRANFENTEAEISQALSEVGQFLEVERSYIYIYTDNGNSIIRSFEWHAEGIASIDKNRVKINRPIESWADFRTKNGKAIRLNTLADLPEEANVFRALLEHASIQSIVQFPLMLEQEVIGFITFETVTRQMSWGEDDIVLLQVVAEVFAGSFKRREVERALIEQRDFAQLVMDNMGQGLAVSWKGSDLSYINPALVKLMGYSAEEMKGKSPLGYTSPDYLQEVQEVRQQWFNGKAATVECKLLTKGGSNTYVSISGNPFYNKGELAGVIAVITDLTGRRKAEEALRNSERLLRTVVSNAPLILFAFDTNSTLTFVEGKGLSYFGIEPKELVGGNAQRLRDDISSYLLDKFTELVARALRGEVVQSVTKIGSRYFEGVYTPVKDAEGRVNGVICVSFDITERMIAEEELKKSLKNERELSNQKSQFIATTSHEFRTPLTIINSSAQLLEYYGHKWTDERKQELYQRIYFSVVNMTDLLDDVLLLNKADAGKLDFNPVALDFSQYCATLLEEIQLGVGTKHQFDLQIEPAPSLMQGDTKLLRQIISNLTTNAIKYSAEGSTVYFRLKYEATKAYVEIEDEGIGIPPEGLEHLFDVFYRAKNAHQIEGTGLGMPIVKKCLETHNGNIEVESELGKGTLCRVWIPLG
ncbi:PAS domain S-box protein [Candidatus Chlorohelix sp.]|uniref:PAS domain S-box protein n=1 Tax=Candidatus Chlorohelix sp. TaxID=3139201 RepID=UPI00305F709A